MAPVVHAPDGGTFGHALCENPQGDVTDDERDVTCGDCLDVLEAPAGHPEALSAQRRDRMRKHGFTFTGASDVPSPAKEGQ